MTCLLNNENFPTMNIVCVHAQCNSGQVTRPQLARTVRTSHENKTTNIISEVLCCGHFSQTFTSIQFFYSTATVFVW